MTQKQAYDSGYEFTGIYSRSNEEAKQRADANRQADERVKQQIQDKVNKRVTETAQRYELEIAALRTKLASTEAERASLLRILDAYAVAMSALQAQAGGTAL